jgi:hypothetical protein
MPLADRPLPSQPAEMSCYSANEEITPICADYLVADAVLKNQSAAFGADLGHASSRGYVK